MLYTLSIWLRSWAQGTEWASVVSPLRVLEYVSFRSAGAALTALLLSVALGPRFFRELVRWNFGQKYQDPGAKQGIAMDPTRKIGVPTMGGLLIVLVLDLTAVLWGRWNTHLQLTLLSVLVLAGLGFYDDYAKVAKQSREAGATERLKLIVQLGLAAFIGLYLWWNDATRPLVSNIMVPFLKEPVLTGAAWLGILITIGTIVGSSNAVNLTDGLDGLAIGCTVITSSVLLVFAYLVGNRVFAGQLLLPYVDGAGELAVFTAALIGAGLGFLWFNCHPAQVFMGDTGALALGGALGIIAVLVHQPFVLLIAGGVFVAEALSVLIQRSWFKFTRRRYGTGRRVFLMAPLHYHFMKKGWYEAKVTIRFYILSIVCALVALSTIKLR
ncbi:MAG: phospho-N-acetylmuramoyl-pentapeptide-transferase [Verrucomicrobiales bacterium]|nr:phospho-N-acetylmuramoyl-pentapeptide-transferase [Verrucomicrobiales bacterium]